MKTNGANETSPETTASTDEEKPKRATPKRKPLWLLLPRDFETIMGDDGQELRQPTRYELYECQGKAEVAKVFEALSLDPTNLAFEHVKIIRGELLPTKLSTQVKLKF